MASRRQKRKRRSKTRKQRRNNAKPFCPICGSKCTHCAPSSEFYHELPPSLTHPTILGKEGGGENVIGENIIGDPQLQISINNSGYNTPNSMIGGYVYPEKKKSEPTTTLKPKEIKGGSNDFIDLGGAFVYNGTSAYNAINGLTKPINPAPYTDQLRFHK